MRIISIINFKGSGKKCQDHPLKRPSEGFLLMELLIALILGLIFISVTTYWKGLIIDTRTEATQRLEMLQKVRRIFSSIEEDNSLLYKLSDMNGTVDCAWRLEPVFIKEVKYQLPTIQQPVNFKMVSMKADWSVNKHKRSAEFITGIIVNE